MELKGDFGVQDVDELSAEMNDDGEFVNGSPKRSQAHRLNVDGRRISASLPTR